MMCVVGARDAAERFYRKEGLQLGFAAVDAAEIRRGIRELAIALEGESRAFPRRQCREGPRRLAEKSS
jgi:hypothetical protein